VIRASSLSQQVRFNRSNPFSHALFEKTSCNARRIAYF
jgi:hypothetical protein